jgi:hypothetical protein
MNNIDIAQAFIKAVQTGGQATLGQHHFARRDLAPAG